MAVNSRQYVTVTPFTYLNSPDFKDADAFSKYIAREMQSLRQTLSDLTEAAVTAADVEPRNPRFGLIKFATGDWATALGGSGWYGYSDAGGGTWKLIKAA